MYKDVCPDWVHIHQTTRAGLSGAGVLALADSVFAPVFLARLVPLLLAAVFLPAGGGLFHLLDDALGGRVLFAQGGDLAGQLRPPLGCLGRRLLPPQLPGTVRPLLAKGVDLPSQNLPMGLYATVEKPRSLVSCSSSSVLSMSRHRAFISGQFTRGAGRFG